jgi:hypothetical protein
MTRGDAGNDKRGCRGMTRGMPGNDKRDAGQ